MTATLSAPARIALAARLARDEADRGRSADVRNVAEAAADAIRARIVDLAGPGDWPADEAVRIACRELAAEPFDPAIPTDVAEAVAAAAGFWPAGHLITTYAPGAHGRPVARTDAGARALADLALAAALETRR
jgi:hypothetical protein